MQWERDARRLSTLQSAEASGKKVVWDEYWGYRSMFTRNELCHRYGLSERGRATFQLALIFGLVSSAQVASHDS